MEYKKITKKEAVEIMKNDKTARIPIWFIMPEQRIIITKIF